MTCLAIPASTSHAIIGAVIGAGMVSGGADFSKLFKIVSCWVFTPISGILLGYVFYRLLAYVLDRTVRSVTQRNLVYSVGVLLTGCYGAYSLGSNNVANVTGVYVGAGLMTPEAASLVGGLSIVSGVLTYSKRVIGTVGKGIVPLDPFSALVTVLAGALTLHIFTQIGVPVSSSQAVVGSVVGVGLVGDLRTVSSKMLLKIVLGWLSTPIFSGVLAWLFAAVCLR
jgi:PiT family inorganic phosphate transporter